MNIDDSIIKSYLEGKDDYKSYWLFKNILDNGEYIFDKPKNEYKDKVKEICEKIYSNLNNFSPYNTELFSKLFPKWKDLIKDINIVLAVGCPSSYDAMVREYNGKEYIILDLIRFMSYEKKDEEIIALIVAMITHEFAHICIHRDYPVAKVGYKNKLIYITFDEGFAHFLSFTNNIDTYNFNDIIQLHYENSVKKLRIALFETNRLKQEKYLEECDCGYYWNKFAAISGKLYLASNINCLHDIYNQGPSVMALNIIE
ncbi:hypothetical protein [Clostridium tarantellae]|uniref:DUF2268 domain-containing protein n=1 Tax=Clostridium tarantellae TaxID=39493 RepID=A0A6I1MNJ0_9CLOT|nr:hypothetical protein [Clostridium tarantellae]MPQ45066.1 hypothetical protein [Clostridium tarantellae]